MLHVIVPHSAGPTRARFNLDAALIAWRSIVGAEHVVVRESVLDQAATATYATKTSVLAIVSPSDVEQVAECLRAAQAHGVPVYPISAGKNWGYGSRSPTSEQAVLLDLGRLDRILDFSEELGTVTVEAGVTFAQLEAFLDAHQSRRFMSSPGTTPHASVIGNAVERGWGFGPYSDRFDFMCGMQVVLPEGEILETGLERFPGTKGAKVFRWGVGPWFDGMFTQSNLGIVTRMTIFLAPKPSHFVSFLYRFDDPSSLAPLMDNLRELKMRGVLRTNFKVQNFYRKFMDCGPYPWGPAQGEWSLSPEMERAQKLEKGIGTWNGAGALYCWSKAHAAAERELVEAAIGPYADHVLFLDDDTLERKDELRESVKARTGYDLDACLHRYFVNTRFRGINKGLGLAGPYWRKRGPMPAAPDPDSDRVGLIWIDPIVPFRGEDVRRATDLAAAIQQRHGFEPNLGLNCVTERAIFMTAALIYDRDVEGDDERALACANDMTDRMMATGYTLGRLTTFNMHVLENAQPASLRLQARIKQLLDPNSILAPGRYDSQDGRR